MENKNKTKAIFLPNLELKKHVAVIHSSNKLTLLQRKIANALLYHAYKNLYEQDEHTIHITKLCELIGYASNDHKSIKNALINLISTVLEWNLVDGEKLDQDGIWNASSIIAGASIEKSICTYSYSTQMRKLLYKPHLYGRLDMLVQAKFQSTYGLALYENCNRFQDIGQTPWFSLRQFRKLMGVEDTKYKIFRDFKTRVLDKAVSEVNQYSQLTISPQLRRVNRQVTEIQFQIKKSTQRKLPEDLLNTTLQEEFGLSVKIIDSIRQQYEASYINNKLKIIKKSTNFRQGKIKNVANYLQAALRENYQMSVSPESPDIIKKPQHNPSVIVAYRRFQEKEVFKMFNLLQDEDQSNLLKQFEKFLTGMYLDVYLRDGLKNLLLQEQLCEFIKKINHPILSQINNFDDWWAKNPIIS